jgi:hypothetical protein
MATPSDVPILGAAGGRPDPIVDPESLKVPQHETQDTEPEMTDDDKAVLQAAQAASTGPIAEITPFGIFVTFFVPNGKVNIGGPEPS